VFVLLQKILPEKIDCQCASKQMFKPVFAIIKAAAWTRSMWKFGFYFVPNSVVSEMEYSDFIDGPAVEFLVLSRRCVF